MFYTSDNYKISIHALREEGDAIVTITNRRNAEFLSTPSARRATLFKNSNIKIHMISIHALREEGDLQTKYTVNPKPKISIHALREEGDVAVFASKLFYFISIHALREEGDYIRSDG